MTCKTNECDGAKLVLWRQSHIGLSQQFTIDDVHFTIHLNSYTSRNELHAFIDDKWSAQVINNFCTLISCDQLIILAPIWIQIKLMCNELCLLLPNIYSLGASFSYKYKVYSIKMFAIFFNTLEYCIISNAYRSKRRTKQNGEENKAMKPILSLVPLKICYWIDWNVIIGGWRYERLFCGSFNEISF